MKKFFLIALAIFISSLGVLAFDSELRSYVPIVLKKGAFVKVVNQRMINTSIADEGDEISFIVPTDVWCGEAKIFPRETMFYGYVEELNEPLQGTNAALKLKINKVVLPDKSEYPVDAYITHKGDISIGGELTAPLEYTKMPHHIKYPNVYKGVLQYVPGNKRFFGQHLIIKAGAELVLMLNEDYNAVISEF